MKTTFNAQKTPSGDFGNPTVLKIAQAAKMVGREKHRMEAFVRFHRIDQEIYYANVEPDFNVLPLISNHFQKRYADQKWVIYDLNRNYGNVSPQIQHYDNMDRVKESDEEQCHVIDVNGGQHYGELELKPEEPPQESGYESIELKERKEKKEDNDVYHPFVLDKDE